MEYHDTPSGPRLNAIDKIFAYFKALPPSDALLLKIAVVAFLVCALWFAVSLSTDSQVEVSASGGTYTEGIVGTPRFINPVLAVTRADKDLSALIYDGLMRLDSSGALAPSIAESVTISEDGLTYNVVLRKDVTFHDGRPLTTDDVVFTIERIQTPALSSPLRSNFDGVRVEKLGEYEMNFVIAEPYVPFIENLTFGILPRHIWQDATNEEFPFSQHNSEPIGAGPYKVASINRNASGIPQSYVLEPHADYHNGTPNIAHVVLHFYTNEDRLLTAFGEGLIDGFSGIDQRSLTNLETTANHELVTMPLPRTFAVFFNQNKSTALRDPAARKALDVAINREELIDSVLLGHGKPLTSPIPGGFGTTTSESVATSTDARFDEARRILREGGWKLNNETGIWEKEISDSLTSLSLSISTVNNSVFESTAEFIRAAWTKLGAEVTVKQFEQSDLTQAIIRPRDYETLLFGTVVGRSLDFYSFWHSSQRNDPGLNVALYANITTDAALREARTNQDPLVREASIATFVEEVTKETPAVFLYNPELLYVFPTKVTGASFAGVSDVHERFATIANWSINTKSVWPIFNDTEN